MSNAPTKFRQVYRPTGRQRELEVLVAVVRTGKRHSTFTRGGETRPHGGIQKFHGGHGQMVGCYGNTPLSLILRRPIAMRPLSFFLGTFKCLHAFVCAAYGLCRMTLLLQAVLVGPQMRLLMLFRWMSLKVLKQQVRAR
jgi:hypothetical protein